MKTTILLTLILISLNSTAQIPSYVPSNGLVGWWPFNGNANDESGNGNHGTVIGATLTNDRNGDSNNAYSFDGVNDYINLSDYPTASNQSFSIFSWLNTPPLSVRRQIISYGSNNIGEGIWLYIDVDNLLHFDYSLQSGVTSTFIVGDNNYHHVGITNDSGNLQLYIDGIPSGQSSFFNPNVSIGGINIGTSIINDNWFYSGRIDELGIWDRTLTFCEIQDLYHAQLGSANTSSTQYQNAIDSYTWPVNNQTYTQSGVYSDTLVNAAGCDSIVTLNLTLDYTGLNDLSEFNVLVSPNPITHSFSISGIANLVSLSLKDMSGKTVKTFDVQEKNHAVSNVSSGVYFLEVRDENQSYIIKVVKE